MVWHFCPPDHHCSALDNHNRYLIPIPTFSGKVIVVLLHIRFCTRLTAEGKVFLSPLCLDLPKDSWQQDSTLFWYLLEANSSPSHIAHFETITAFLAALHWLTRLVEFKQSQFQLGLSLFHKSWCSVIFWKEHSLSSQSCFQLIFSKLLWFLALKKKKPSSTNYSWWPMQAEIFHNKNLDIYF